MAEYTPTTLPERVAAEHAVVADCDAHPWTCACSEPHRTSRQYAAHVATVAAQTALREAADEFFARLPDGTPNGRAYNSYRVSWMLRDRADRMEDR